MLEQHPIGIRDRPQSAMDGTMTSSPNSNYVYYPTRRMPTPNGPMNTSVKSVFDCELGCFVEDEHLHTDNTVSEHHSHSHHTSTPPDDVTPTSPMSDISRTSEPRDV